MQEIYIGVDNQNYTKFDDGEVLGAYPFPHVISKIDVEFNATHVIGINVTYRVGNGQFIAGQSSLKFKNTPVVVKTFIVPEGDFISEIFGTFENVINSIGFKTYRGNCENFGNPIGINFRHFSPGNTFTAAKGSVGSWLNFISFRVVPMPQQPQQMPPMPPPQMQQQSFPQTNYMPPPPPPQQPYPYQQQPQYPPQQPYPPQYYPPPQYPQQPYPYPTYTQSPPQNTTTVIEVVDTNPYSNPYGGGYNNYYQKQGMGTGAALGLGMLTGVALADMTHHHHGGFYDVNLYGGGHHHRHGF